MRRFVRLEVVNENLEEAKDRARHLEAGSGLGSPGLVKPVSQDRTHRLILETQAR